MVRERSSERYFKLKQEMERKSESENGRERACFIAKAIEKGVFAIYTRGIRASTIRRLADAKIRLNHSREEGSSIEWDEKRRSLLLFAVTVRAVGDRSDKLPAGAIPREH